jgi:hypothetical protein
LIVGQVLDQVVQLSAGRVHVVKCSRRTLPAARGAAVACGSLGGYNATGFAPCTSSRCA